MCRCVTSECVRWPVWPRPPLPAARSQPRTELSRGSGTSHSFCHSGFPWNPDVRHMSMSDTTWSPIVDCLWSRYIWCLVFFNNCIKNQWGLFLSDGHTRVKLIEHFCPIPVTQPLSRWSSYRQAHMTTPSIDWVFKSLWPPFHSPSFTTRPTNAQQMKKADINSFILGCQTHFQLTAHFLSLPHTSKLEAYETSEWWSMHHHHRPALCMYVVSKVKKDQISLLQLMIDIFPVLCPPFTFYDWWQEIWKVLHLSGATFSVDTRYLITLPTTSRHCMQSGHLSSSRSWLPPHVISHQTCHHCHRQPSWSCYLLFISEVS